ncbi:MAG: mechanosensitive ion channel family protein [Chloroflexaceae bacterium]|nr:mechanosensitive ion channel family protein [Chloroflexaceae bacterium]
MIEAFEATHPFQLLVQRLLTTAAILITALLVGVLVERIVLRWLNRLTRRTSWGGDDRLLQVLQGGVTTLWFGLLGVYLAVRGIELPIPYLNTTWTFQGIVLSSRHADYLFKVLLTILVISLTIAASRFVVGVAFARDASEHAALSIFHNIIRIVTYLIGFLIILGLFNIEITPFLAAVGVSSLAVSLALQETLSNLFSGIQIILSRNIKPGDYVRLGSGEEGFVIDINWRTTTIQQLANNMVIVPNSMLTTAIVTNYNEPQKEMGILVQIGVGYESDLEHVERVTVEVAREVLQEVEGGVPEIEPFIRYHTFGEYSINFATILRGKEFVSQFLLKHEFVKRLHRRYQQEGIVIPFPIRTIHTAHAASSAGPTNHQLEYQVASDCPNQKRPLETSHTSAEPAQVEPKEPQS